MKPLIAFILALLPPLALAAEAVLEFENGDRINGQLKDIQVMGGLSLAASPQFGGEDRIIWSSPLLSDDASFALKDLEKVTFDGEALPDFEINTLVHFGTGDIHEGRLVSLDDKTVALDTSYAGRIEIDRTFISQLRFPALSKYAYFGPNRLEEWIIHGDQSDWRLEDGILSTELSETIGLDRVGTDQMWLTFDAQWKASASFSLILCANSAKPGELSAGYRVRISGGRVVTTSMRKGRDQNERRIFANFDRFPELDAPGGGRFDIFVDRKRGRLEIWFQGERIHDWNDNVADRKALGGSLLIENQLNQPLSFADIEMIPWDGTVPDMDALKVDQTTMPSGKGDELVLFNGDSVSGKIGELEEGKLELEAAGVKVRMPIERIRLMRLFNPLYLENARMPPPRRYNRDVRARLRSGRSVTFRLIGVKEGKLKAFNEAVGEFLVDPSALSEIEFDLYGVADPSVSLR